MVYVKELDSPPVAEQIAVLRKIGIQRQNLINADFARAVTQFAEIKPLSALYKPIQDSMAGIFQNRIFFKYTKEGPVFNEEGIVAFTDDLQSKNIRSSVAIAQALEDTAINGPQIGQARSGYARELAAAFYKLGNIELTTAQIIAVIMGEAATATATPMPLLGLDDIAVNTPFPISMLTPTSTPTPSIGSRLPTPIIYESAFRPIRPPGSKSTLTEATAISRRSKLPSSLASAPDPTMGPTATAASAAAAAAADPAAAAAIAARKAEDDKIMKKMDTLFEGFTKTRSETFEASIRRLAQDMRALSGDRQDLIERWWKDAPGSQKPAALTPTKKQWLVNQNLVRIPGLQAWKSEFGPNPPPKSGKGIMLTSLAEAEKRFKLLLGSMKAGNTSKKVKTELKGLADLLYKKGKLSKNSNIAIQKL